MRFRGLRRGGKSRITLVESVRQDRAKKLTMFDQEYVEQRGRQRKSRRFSLVFRTLTVPQMTRRLESAGFRIKAVLGDYNGRALGSAGRRVADSRGEVLEFHHVRPFKMGVNQA